MQRIPVFAVSLVRAQQRRASMIAHLRKLGCGFELVDAVDGALLPPDQRRALQAEGTDLHPGTIGCYLSHMEVYRRIVAAGLPAALVLEDDARLDPRIVPALRERPRSLDFDYCLLDYHEKNPAGPIYYDRASGVEVIPGFTAYATHDAPTSSHAYLVTGHEAARRLGVAFPIRKPVDIYRLLPYRPRFRAMVSPFGAGVSEESLRSLTSDHRDRLRLPWLRRLPGYYAVRELVSTALRERRAMVPELVRRGVLPATGDWAPLPPGRRFRS
jgi:glycosyl transferase, family 25